MPTDRSKMQETGRDPKQFRQQRQSGRFDSEFVNLELSVDEKTALRARYTDFSVFDSDAESLLADGVKVTSKWDERGKCYVCFAFGDEGSDNSGYVLTGRGGSLSRAYRELLFKHCVLLEGDWAGYHNRQGGETDEDW